MNGSPSSSTCWSALPCGALRQLIFDNETSLTRLHASEVDLRTIVDTVPVGIMFAEAGTGRIVRRNKRMGRIEAIGCATVADVRDLDPRLARRGTTVVGQRIIHELRGESCLDLATMAATRKGCAVTRSFSARLEDLAMMEQDVAAHATRFGEKLRRERLGTDHMTVFYQTSEHDRRVGERHCHRDAAAQRHAYQRRPGRGPPAGALLAGAAVARRVSRFVLLPRPNWRTLETAAVIASGVCLSFAAPGEDAQPLCNIAVGALAPAPAWFVALDQRLFGALAGIHRPLDVRSRHAGDVEVRLEALRHIRQWDRRARVLVLSMHANPAFATKAFEAGATGYATKSGDPADLVLHLERVSRGERTIAAEVADPLALAGGEASLLRPLSPRETEILRLVASG